MRFGRFAYPPNELGYCGPSSTAELLEYVDAGVVDGGLRALCRGFEGAWPYLELIAHESAIADPLDARVVEAYWIGNGLLDRVRLGALGDSFESRFRGQSPRTRSGLTDVVQEAPRPHHNFHVFCVYPWVGLLRTGATDHALHVLDRCRVRVARVETVAGSTAEVEFRPLRWDGTALSLGARERETLAIATNGARLTPLLEPGDVVACHWGWICERLTVRQTAALRDETARQLVFANRLRVPPPATVLS